MDHIENFLRKMDLLALANVGSYLRRGNDGKMIYVSAHTRVDLLGMAKDLSQSTEHLNDQQLELSINYLRINYNRLRADQQKAAQHLIDHLEQARQERAASSVNLKHTIDPLRSDENKFDWNDYRKNLRGITD